VSYTGADEAWATWVGAQLERAGQRVRLQAWDSPAGENFVVWISEQMQAAGRTVAVCSPDYFTSHWCTQEWTGALARRKVVPLRVVDCVLPPTLATIGGRDLFGLDEDAACSRLLEAVGLAEVPRVASAGFPGTPAAGAIRFPGRLPEVWNVPAKQYPRVDPSATKRSPIPPVQIVRTSVLIHGRVRHVTWGSPGLPVAFCPDSRWLATGSFDKMVGLWDLADPTRPYRRAILTAGHRGWVVGVAFSPDGRWLAGAWGTVVCLWDVADQTPPHRCATVTSPLHDVYAVAISPDGCWLAASLGGILGKSVGLWDVADPTHPTRRATLTSNRELVYAVAFSPGGRWLEGLTG